MVNPLLDTTKKYIRDLEYDLLNLSINSVRSQFAHVYYIWRTLRQSIGSDKALEVYSSIWDSLNAAAFSGAKEALGITEVKDLPTLGLIIERVLTGIPCLYETVQSTKDVHIGHIHWCANPAYGPSDNIFNRLDYYRQEVIVTVDPCLSGLVKEAKKMGFIEDVEIEVPAGRCRDGNASFCEFILRRKDSPKIERTILPDSKKKFIEFNMDGKEPLLFILDKQGRTLEDQGPASFLGFFIVDLTAYDIFEKKLGKQRGMELYQKLWLYYPIDWVKEARLELEIGHTSTIDDIARIVSFCEKKKYVPYQIRHENNDRIALIAKNDPFVEISTKFGGTEIGSNYLKAVASTELIFLNQIIKELKFRDMVTITIKKMLAKGDEENLILIERR